MNEANSSRKAVLADVIRLIAEVTAEWDFDSDIGESTRLFGDYNWQSVDMVVLAHEIQQHFRRSFAFNDFLADVATREPPGITVGELTDFVISELEPPGYKAAP
jgi:acyl carrier protein